MKRSRIPMQPIAALVNRNVRTKSSFYIKRLEIVELTKRPQRLYPLTTKDKSAKCLACFTAFVNLLWCFAQRPDLILGIIFPLSVRNLLRSETSSKEGSFLFVQKKHFLTSLFWSFLRGFFFGISKTVCRREQLLRSVRPILPFPPPQFFLPIFPLFPFLPPQSLRAFCRLKVSCPI